MAASFSLIIEDDAGKQIVVPFAKDVITIGRKEGNTIRLTERNVSRFHAKLSKESNHVVVEDLTSFNGVKLNGDRIAGRVEVGAGDVIEIGDYHLELRTAQTSATTQKMGPAGAKSAGIDHAPQTEDDEFEGDTQRWDQPAGAAAIAVAATADMRAPLGNFNSEGDTEKLDLDKLSAMVAAGQSAPPPAPLTPAQSWPPPPRSAAPPSLATAEMEATVRQPSAPPPPLAAPPPAAPPPAFSAPSAPTAPHVPAPAAVDDDTDATQDMPRPAVAQARANLLAQGVGVRREAPAVEQTEQMKVVPSLADDLALPRLVVLNTIFSGSTFPLRAMENVLGRTDDNDIVLEHRSVSRNHAKLVREGERVRILDLKSANGVLVNGDEVEQHVLKSGDVIELGRVRIRFVPVGERFVVPADEIERARIADANGGDVEENSGVTANGTRVPKGADQLVAKKPIALYAILAVLVVMVLVLGAIVMSGKDAPAEAPAAPTAVGAIDTDVAPAAVVAEVETAVEPAAAEPAAKPGKKVAATEVAPVVKEREKPKEREPVAAAATPAPVDNEKQFEEARRALFSSDTSRGVKLLDDLVKRNPREPRFQLALAAGCKQLGQTAKARQHYEAFLGLQPSGPDAEKVRGILKDLR